MAESELVGTWRKQAGDPGADPYPADLNILPGGQYRGSAAMPGEYTVWDVGTWDKKGSVVEISTANDAVIAYRYALSGDELRFEDPQGGTIRYVRARD